jgi:hypothetical protein
MSFIINPFMFGNGVPKLLEEQFEAPGASGWTSVVNASAIAWVSNYTTAPAPLLGSYSCRIQNTTGSTNAYKNFAASGTVYCRFRINHQRVSGGNSTLITFNTATGTQLAVFQLASGNSRTRVNVSGGSTVVGTVTPTQNLTYYGWFEYGKATSGANAFCRAGLSTTAERPTNWTGINAASNNGTTTANAERIQFGSPSGATNYDVIIDDIQIQDTPFA